MVGRQILALKIGVRVPVPEPVKSRLLGGFLVRYIKKVEKHYKDSIIR